MKLYSVHFTNKHTVTKYNRNGKKIGKYIDDIPHASHALPHSTARQYATCDNFRLERYYIEANQQTKNNRGYDKSAKKPILDESGDITNTGDYNLKQAALSGNLAAGLSAA